MKYLITIVILLASNLASAQMPRTDTTQVSKGTLLFTSSGIAPGYELVRSGDLIFGNDEDLILKTRYDSTILNKGEEKCSHHYAQKDVNGGMYSGRNGYSCAVWHGITGCPDTWLNVNFICTICLRHFNIREFRWTEKKPNEYDEALKRLQEKTNKKPTPPTDKP